MARPKIEINLQEIQEILNQERSTFKGKIMDYFNHCADTYNNKFNPLKGISGANIYTRVKTTNELTCDLKGGTKSLTDDHKKKLLDANQQSELDLLKNKLKLLVVQLNNKTKQNYSLKFGQENCTIYFAEELRGPTLKFENMQWYLMGASYQEGLDHQMWGLTNVRPK